jgi:hypothetical protein
MTIYGDLPLDSLNQEQEPLPFDFHNYGGIPQKFYRVTDSRSFNKPGQHCANNSCGRLCVAFGTKAFARDESLPINERLTAESLKQHLQWRHIRRPQSLISLCGTRDKALVEVEWRLKKGRRNIQAAEISTTGLEWDVLVLKGGIEVDVLVDFGLGYWVVFVRATDLIRVFGLNGLLKEGVEFAAKDEWFAVDWIPQKKVFDVEYF